jgi:hypothetical protein
VARIGSNIFISGSSQVSHFILEKALDTQIVRSLIVATERSDAFGSSCGDSRNSSPIGHPLPVRKNIRIENPFSGRGFTSSNRAKRFVKHGLAKWVEPGISIRFLRNPTDHRDLSVRENVDATRYWYERSAHSGVAQLTALANTPVVAPAKLLGLGKRKGASRHTFLAAQGL